MSGGAIIREGLKMFLGMITGVVLVGVTIQRALQTQSFSAVFVPLGLVAAGAIVWMIWQKTPSAFLNGLLISVCAGLLLCAACDALLFTVAKHGPHGP